MQGKPTLQLIFRRVRNSAILIAIVVFLLAIQFAIERIGNPAINHTLSPTETSAKVIWSKNNLSDQMISDENALYAYAYSGRKLFAADPVTGEMIWEVNRQGARNLVVSKGLLFVSTSTSIDAYDLKNGELMWTTFLGDGHVSIMLQVDSGVLRVYYGDYIYEIDPLTGIVLSKSNKENILWVVGDTQIIKVDNCKVEALNTKTGELIWEQCYMLRVVDGKEPQQLTMYNSLIVHLENDWVCSINLGDGDQNWCSQNVYISNAAIDFESKQVYALREDFSLVTIDLLTGATQTEVRFLTNVETNAITYSKVVYSKDVVIVYFADSEQTYALDMEK